MNLADTPFAAYLGGLVASSSDMTLPLVPKGAFNAAPSETSARVPAVLKGMATDRPDLTFSHYMVFMLQFTSDPFEGSALIIRHTPRPGAKVEWNLVRQGDFVKPGDPITRYATVEQAALKLAAIIQLYNKTTPITGSLRVEVSVAFVPTRSSAQQAVTARNRTTVEAPTTTMAPARLPRGAEPAARLRYEDDVVCVPTTDPPIPRQLRGGAPGEQGLIGPRGFQGLQGVPGNDGVNASYISYESDHPGPMTRGMAVCVINGMIRRATSIAPYNKCIGFLAEDELLQGVTGRVQTGGHVITTALMWDLATGMVGGLVPEQQYFLSADGDITPTAPTTPGQYVAPIGIALDSTSLRIELNTQILL